MKKARDLSLILAVMTAIGLGIGITIASLSFASAFSTTSLPFQYENRVSITEGVKQRSYPGVSLPDLIDLMQHAKIFSGVSAYTTSSPESQAWFISGNVPLKISPAFVSSNFFDVLGIKPELGGRFDDSEAPQIILGGNLWRKYFGSDPDIIGKKIRVNGSYYEVIAVISPDFDLPLGTDLWIRKPLFDPNYVSYRTNYSFSSIGVLQPGISAAAAQSAADIISQDLQKRYPASNNGIDFILRPFAEGLQSRLRSVARVFYVLSLSLLGVIWMSCFTLIIVQQIHRRTEISIRVALGSSRFNIFARLAKNVLGITVAATLLGGLFGRLLLFQIQAIASPLLPRYVHPKINWSIFALCAGTTLLIALAIVLYSVWRIWHASPAEMLSQANQRISLNRKSVQGLRVLLAFDIGISTAIVICALIFMNQAISLEKWSFGIEEKDLVDAEFIFPEGKIYSKTDLVSSFDEIVRRMQQLPGVRNAAIAMEDPFNNHYNAVLNAPNQRDPIVVSRKGITPDYFQAIGIPVIRGRGFTQDQVDRDISECLVDNHLAALFWPGQDPIGRSFKVAGVTRQIIGVTGDVNFFGRGSYNVYVPIREMMEDQQKIMYSHIYLRVQPSFDSHTIGNTAVNAVPGILVSQPVFMKSKLDRYLVFARFISRLSGPIAVLSILLSGLGAFGIVAYISVMKSRDIATRLTLGATRSRIAIGFAQFVFISAFLGVIGGVVLVWLTAPLWSGLAARPLSLELMNVALSVGLMLFLLFLATFIPIFQASKTDPAILMRGL